MSVGLTTAAPASSRSVGASVRAGVRVAASTVSALVPTVLGDLRWIGRHWRWTALAVLVAVVAGLAHRPTVVVFTVVCVLVPATVSTTWAARAPVSHDRWIGAPWRRSVWRVRHHLTWSATTEAVGLGRTVTRTRTRDGKREQVKVWKPARARVRTSPLGVSLTITVPRGLGVSQVLATGEAIAAAAPAASFRTRRLSPSKALIELTMVDVLAVPRHSVEPTADPVPVVVGRREDGEDFTWCPITGSHLGLQGQTRSGKSVCAYTLLGGLAFRPDVLVCGVDPSGILLSPWKAGRGGAWIATGTHDLTRAATALHAVVAEMDRRIAALEVRGLDQLAAFTVDLPVLVVVLEEWPGLLSAARTEDNAAGRQGADRIAPRIERAAGRLLKEGAKVGVRVLPLAQRMSSKAIDTDDRSNVPGRITLRVDSMDAIRMFHDGAEAMAQEVREFAPGVALVEAPGLPFQRARMDFTSFAVYRRRVASGISSVGSFGFVAGTPVHPVHTTAAAVPTTVLTADDDLDTIPAADPIDVPISFAKTLGSVTPLAFRGQPESEHPSEPVAQVVDPHAGMPVRRRQPKRPRTRSAAGE